MAVTPYGSGAPANSLYNTQSIRIEEIINKKMGIFLPTFDKVWEDMIVTNQTNGPQSDLGRDWLIVKTFMGGLTGVVEAGGPGSDFTLYGDPANTAQGAKLFTQGLTKTFPNPMKGMNQMPFRLGVPMRSMTANIMLTLGELQAEATPAFIGQIVVPKMEGFARHIAFQLCNYFYLSQNQNYRLTNTTTTTIPAIGSGADFSFIELDLTTTNYGVHRFVEGMLVDIYDSTNTQFYVAATTDTQFYVAATDRSQCKVILRAFNPTTNAVISDLRTVDAGGTGGTALNGVANHYVVFGGSKGSATTPFAASPYFTGISGIHSWMKYGDDQGSTETNNNCLLGAERVGTNYNINVNTHPEFKSLYFNHGNQPLTEHSLRKYLARWHASKSDIYGQDIDTLIASDGVWLAYQSQLIAREYYNRTGKLASLNSQGSEGGFTFEFDGRSYKGYTSHFVDANKVYGIKRGGGNWKRYVPPDPRGVRRFDRTDSWIPFRFVGSALTQTSSNQIPIFTASGNHTMVTEGVQMPGMLRMQLVPDQPAGLLIDNVAEDRVYASNFSVT